MAKTNYDVPAVRKAIRLIEILGESTCPLGVTEISRLLETNKNMTFRLLTTLEDEGWIKVAENGPKYALTLQPFRATSKPVSRLSVKEAATQPLRNLWERTGQSVYLGVLHHSQVLYLEHFDSIQSVKVAGTIGGHYPLHCTAPGKALLAFSDSHVIEQVLAGDLTRFTDNTMVDKRSLEREIETIRDNGWAMDNEEFARGVICLAVPLFDFADQLAGTIGMTVTTLAYDMQTFQQEMLPGIRETGALVSQHLGHNAQPASNTG